MITNIYDIAVIGGGPAGLMAAFRASECGAKVVIIEKNNTPGIKLLMTGKERCNITNFELNIDKFLKNFGKNGRFLKNSLYRFGVQDTIEFFHNNKLMTKVERGNRIFPESNKSKDVLELFLKLINNEQISLLTSHTVTEFQFRDNKIDYISVKKTDNSGIETKITAENYIICTGGLSYPKTGSTGDGYYWAETMGHTVVKPAPALTPLAVTEKWVEKLDKLKLRNVKVLIYQNSKKIDERFGEAEFTRYGLNGPIILDISKRVGELLKNGLVNVFLDLKPALDFDILDKRILRDLTNNGRLPIKAILEKLLPKQLISVILELSKIDPEKEGSTISKKDRKNLRMLLKQLPLTVKSVLGFNKAVITAGGICLNEIEPKTMQSKLVNNLYFAGEILDLDGPTGGYNLQVCWSTGYVAGENAAVIS